MCLLADLPDPESYQSVGWIVVGLSSVAVAVYYVLEIWRMLFPKEQPPAHETYATKAELKELEADTEEEIKRVEDRFEEWIEGTQENHRDSVAELRRTLEAFTEWQRSIERGFGRMEAKIEGAGGAQAGGKKG